MIWLVEACNDEGCLRFILSRSSNAQLAGSVYGVIDSDGSNDAAAPTLAITADSINAKVA